MISAIRGRVGDIMLQRVVEAQRPLSPGQKKWRLAITATLLTLAGGNAALAQAAGGDILGVTSVETAFIGFLDIVAIMGVGYGFMRLMSGRHTLEGLMCMGVGVLGIAKAPAIATFLGA